MKKTKEVQGFYYDGNKDLIIQRGDVMVSFISDKHGKTLALTFEDKHQITIDFESIKEFMKNE